MACAVWLGVAVTLGCGRSGESQLAEIARSRSDSVDVVLLSADDGLSHGQDTFVIEFRSASDGALIDAGDVRGSATMPMGGNPMLGTIEVKRSAVAGRYMAESKLEMSGTWRMAIEWEGPSGRGQVTFSENIR
jgi:YtkA-like protein